VNVTVIKWKMGDRQQSIGLDRYLMWLLEFCRTATIQQDSDLDWDNVTCWIGITLNFLAVE